MTNMFEIKTNKYGKINWTDEMITFLRENHSSMTSYELAKAIGLKRTIVRMKCYELGLKKMEMEYWTKDQVDFLLAYWDLMGDTEIAEVFESMWPKNKRWTEKHIRKKRIYLNLHRTKSQVNKVRRRNANQGRYNTVVKRWESIGARNQGDIAIWHFQDGRQMPVVKWSGGRFFGIYDTLSHIVWLLHYGPVKDNMMIVHKDGDTLNCAIENLEMISREENSKRNASKSIGVLSDNYVRGILTQGDPELRNLIPQELIELKRQQLILNRNINNHGQ